MKTLKKQFIVEINVLNVNRREGRVFGGFLRVLRGVLVYCLTPFNVNNNWVILGNIIKVKYAKEKEKLGIRKIRHSQSS